MAVEERKETKRQKGEHSADLQSDEGYSPNGKHNDEEAEGLQPFREAGVDTGYGSAEEVDIHMEEPARCRPFIQARR